MIPATIPEYKLGANLPMLYNRPRFTIPEQPSISGLNLQTDRTIFVPTMMMTAVQQSHTNMVIPCKTIGPISGGGYKRPPPGNIMLGSISGHRKRPQRAAWHGFSCSAPNRFRVTSSSKLFLCCSEQ